MTMDRPTIHGKYLGEALALIAREGRKASPMALPEPCLTCAFRSGTVPNMSAGTGMAALNCAMRVDDDEFACHHGLEDGRPTRVCAGYIAALLAPFDKVKEIVSAMHDQLTRLGNDPDLVRADFDAWWARVDPDQKMDVYQLARAYAARTRQ